MNMKKQDVEGMKINPTKGSYSGIKRIPINKKNIERPVEKQRRT